MIKQTLLAAVVALNLSYMPGEGLAKDANTSQHCGFYNNNPFCGARSLDIVLDRETWDTPKKPIPYIEYWGNDLGQTAQQMVAICYLLEVESDLRCDIRLLHFGTAR